MVNIGQNVFPENIAPSPTTAEDPPSKPSLGTGLAPREQLEALKAKRRIEYVKAFLNVLGVPCPENTNCFGQEDIQAVVQSLHQGISLQESSESQSSGVNYDKFGEIIAPFWQIAMKTGAQVSAAFPAAPDGIDKIPTPLKVWFLGYSMITDALGNEVVLVPKPDIRNKFIQAQRKLIQEFSAWKTKNWKSTGTDKKNVWQTLMPLLSRIWKLVNIVE